MLARSVLGRLAAQVPKTSTHDLPRLSHLLQSSLLASNATSRPTAGAIARAFRQAILEGRRAYATTSATEPTPRVKKDVKKAVAKKPAAKKPTAKKPATKKAAPKKAKKPAAKKPAARKTAKKPKKELTPEQKERAIIKDLKAKALDAPKTTKHTAWLVFSAENIRSQKVGSIQEAGSIAIESSAKYKNLTPAEREHYNHLAREKNEQAVAERNRWILERTPEEIHKANLARAALRRKGFNSFKYNRLVDDRFTKRVPTPYIIFYLERYASGDFAGIHPKKATALVGEEWKALSAAEKQKYRDQYAASAKAAA